MPGPGGSAAGLVAALLFARCADRAGPLAAQRAEVATFAMPEVVTPFSVLGLLREIEHKNGLPAPQLQELATSIQQLERHYFAGSNGAEPDLKNIAESWIARAS